MQKIHNKQNNKSNIYKRMDNFESTDFGSDSISNSGRNIDNIFSQDKRWEQNQYLNHQSLSTSTKQKKQNSLNLSQPTSHFSLSDLYSTKNLQVNDLDQFQVDKNKEIQRMRYKKIFKPNYNKVEKNTNVSKYFMRQFIMNFGKQEQEQFSVDPYLMGEVRALLSKQRKLYRESSQNKNVNNNLDSLNNIFGVVPLATMKASMLSQKLQLKYAQKKSFEMRKIAHRMIRQKIIPGVFKSSQIKGHNNKKAYIYTLKVEMLRCQSAELIKRTQIS